MDRASQEERMFVERGAGIRGASDCDGKVE